MAGETSSRPTIASFEILWEWDGYQGYAALKAEFLLNNIVRIFVD
jgi:hypothetical protein